IIVFVLQMIFPWIVQMFLLNPLSILQKPWTVVTYLFLHDGGLHLLFNMYALYLFGTFLEQKIGYKRFLLVYFSTGIGAAILYSIPYLVTNTPLQAVGASGAVMGVIGALILVMPDLKLLFFFVIPMPLWVA